jgi:ABC-type multidrug transport system ATPase subunit
VIDIQNVSKYFSKKAAVKNLSLTIKSGEVYGFLGQNGAGKTTTMKMILGLLKPDSGKILLFGKQRWSFGCP